MGNFTKETNKYIYKPEIYIYIYIYIYAVLNSGLVLPTMKIKMLKCKKFTNLCLQTV